MTTVRPIIQITFRNLRHSDAIEGHVRRRAEKLSAACRRVVACQVTIETPHRSKHHGQHYRVRIDLTMPRTELVVDRCPDAGRECEDVYVAIDQAFDHAMRRLREDGRRRRPAHVRLGA